MILLDELSVPHKDAASRRIEVAQGDLSDLPPDQHVDLLVVSAFPDNYEPVPGTLMHALHRKGVDVEALAARKHADLRATCSCWLSERITSDAPGIQFDRILCFEPLMRGTPPETVGDIFRALTPFLTEPTSVAMPVVAAGQQGWDVEAIFAPLLDAAVHWMSLGLPLTHLKVVEKDPARAETLRALFASLKPRYETAVPVVTPSESAFDYDVFISYARANEAHASALVAELKAQRPGLRVFVDQQELNPGAAWQQSLFEALDACRRVIALYSPEYVASKVCKEEWNIAWCRHRESDEPILYPIYLQTAPLPTYMRLVQYTDCREADAAKIRSAAAAFLRSLDQ
jgi:TIR domain.